MKTVAVFANLMRRFSKEAVSMTADVSYWVLTLCFFWGARATFLRNSSKLRMRGLIIVTER